VALCLGAVLAGRRVLADRERERARHMQELRAERDRLDDQVVLRTAELEDLARYLQTVREDERSHLARELHDELGGLLTAAKLDVARVRKRLPDAGADLAERIGHLAATLDAGIALKRRIIEDLRPSSLDHLGLTQTLRIQCSEFARRTELAVDASIAETGLAGEPALAVYRLVQEALTNISKYAQARQVHVMLEVADGQARLSVSDDGIGFDPAHTRLGAHGLAGMRFRVQSVGGRWQLHSAPGQGTTVRAEIPLPAVPSAPAAAS
jgi:signal transduction histidine kinase